MPAPFLEVSRSFVRRVSRVSTDLRAAESTEKKLRDADHVSRRALERITAC
jgi:hypothetical protein